MTVATQFYKLIVISAWCAEKCTAGLAAQALLSHVPEAVQMINAKCSACGGKALFIDPFYPYHNEYTLCGRCVRVERFEPLNEEPSLPIVVTCKQRERKEMLNRIAWVAVLILLPTVVVCIQKFTSLQWLNF